MTKVIIDELEERNVGKPTNSGILIDRHDVSLDIPQAWYNHTNGAWYYNYPGAMLECGDRIPTKHQWEEIIKKYGLDTVTETLGRSGHRDFLNGCCSDERYKGYYWSSTPFGPNGSIALIFGRGIYSIGVDNNESGLTIRCLKKKNTSIK